jgi:hypothetical protein
MRGLPLACFPPIRKLRRLQEKCLPCLGRCEVKADPSNVETPHNLLLLTLKQSALYQ